MAVDEPDIPRGILAERMKGLEALVREMISERDRQISILSRSVDSLDAKVQEQSVTTLTKADYEARHKSIEESVRRIDLTIANWTGRLWSAMAIFTVANGLLTWLLTHLLSSSHN